MQKAPFSMVIGNRTKGILPVKSQLERYRSLSQADYVIAVVFTGAGRVPVVCQYGPALEQFTLESCGGLADAKEIARVRAMRKLDRGNRFEAYYLRNEVRECSPRCGPTRDLTMTIRDEGQV